MYIQGLSPGFNQAVAYLFTFDGAESWLQYTGSFVAMQEFLSSVAPECTAGLSVACECSVACEVLLSWPGIEPLFPTFEVDA